MILRDTYKRVHLLGHSQYPRKRSICGMVDIRWKWAGPHLTDDPRKVNCGRCLALYRERLRRLYAADVLYVSVSQGGCLMLPSGKHPGGIEVE